MLISSTQRQEPSGSRIGASAVNDKAREGGKLTFFRGGGGERRGSFALFFFSRSDGSKRLSFHFFRFSSLSLSREQPPSTMTRARGRGPPSSALGFLALLLCCLVLLRVSASSSPQAATLPRGVRPSRAQFYPDALESSSSSSTFRCLDGSGEALPASRINDDYCDCVDGSDEPGERNGLLGREWKERGREKKEGKDEKEEGIRWRSSIAIDPSSATSLSRSQPRPLPPPLQTHTHRQGPPPAPTASSSAPTRARCRS